MQPDVCRPRRSRASQHGFRDAWDIPAAHAFDGRQRRQPETAQLLSQLHQPGRLRLVGRLTPFGQQVAELRQQQEYGFPAGGEHHHQAGRLHFGGEVSKIERP